MKSGWHKLQGYTVFIIQNEVIFGTSYSGTTTYPYKWDKKNHCYIKCESINVHTFISGVRRGTIKMR